MFTTKIKECMIYTDIPVSMFKENNMTALLFSSSSYLCIPSLLSINHCSKLCVYLYDFSLSISILEKYFVLKTDHLFKLDLEKAEEPEIKLPTSVRSSKKQESSRKTSTSALLTMPKPLTEWITINCGKFSKRWEYQTTWPASREICMHVRNLQLELDMEQQTGS